MKHASTQAGASASKPDTDNVQSGDQTGPDKKGTAEQKDATDTDNVQSGDQAGPDTGARDGTGDGDNVQSGSQTGPETPDSGGNG